MKVVLNAVERVLLQKLFTDFRSPMSVEKIALKKGIMECLELSEEEKKAVDYAFQEATINQIKFDSKKATDLKVEFDIGGWQLDIIKTWLHYSDLLDDMQESHFTLYEKFCTVV